MFSHSRPNEGNLRIGFLSIHNPYDRTSFSGTAYYAFSALHELKRANLISELRVLGNHARLGKLSKIISKVRKLAGMGDAPMRLRSRRDHGHGLDCIISLASHDLACSSFPRLEAPLVLVTDATPSFLRDFYGYDISKDSEKAEGGLIREVDMTIYSSQFMADQARKDFDLDDEVKVEVIPFGVNFDHLPTTAHAPARPPGKDAVALLFIGREWERKGGALVLSAVEVLRGRGINASLTIIGADPAEAHGKNHVNVIPYLNKNNRKDRQVFEETLKSTHLFLLPTRADCTPMVIAEANAFSIPVLATNVGGIPSLVSDSRNGYLMPLEAQAVDWAEKIEALISDPTAYANLRQSSYGEYRDRLNWKAWASRLRQLIIETVGPSNGSDRS